MIRDKHGDGARKVSCFCVFRRLLCSFLYIEVSLADVGVVDCGIRSHIYFCSWACFSWGWKRGGIWRIVTLLLHACFFFRILDQRSNFID